MNRHLIEKHSLTASCCSAICVPMGARLILQTLCNASHKIVTLSKTRIEFVYNRGLAWIARKHGCSERQMTRYVKQLIDSGLISRNKGARRQCHETGQWTRDPDAFYINHTYLLKLSKEGFDRIKDVYQPVDNLCETSDKPVNPRPDICGGSLVDRSSKRSSNNNKKVLPSDFSEVQASPTEQQPTDRDRKASGFLLYQATRSLLGLNGNGKKQGVKQRPQTNGAFSSVAVESGSDCDDRCRASGGYSTNLPNRDLPVSHGWGDAYLGQAGEKPV